VPTKIAKLDGFDDRLMGQLCAGDKPSQGCPAGQWPSIWTAECQQPGWRGDVSDTPGAFPMLPAPPPSVVSDTRFCSDSGSVGICAPDRSECGKGKMKMSFGCAAVGTPIGCPDGFISGEPGAAVGCVVDEGICASTPYRKGPKTNGSPVHVAASAAAGGDGSPAAPFSKLEAALKAAPTGALIRVAKGTYDGPFTIDRPLAVVGVCAAEVVITGGKGVAAIRVTGPTSWAEIELVGLTLKGPGVGLQVSGGPPVRARLLHVVDATGDGILVSGDKSELDLSDAIVRGTNAEAPGAGSGLTVVNGGLVKLNRVDLVNNQGAGLLIQGASVDARALGVHHTRPAASGQAGYGIQVAAGGGLGLRGGRLLGNHDVGAIVVGAKTSLQAWGLLIDQTQPRKSDGDNGIGLAAVAGAWVRLHGARLSWNRRTALLASDPGTTVGLYGFIADRTQASSKGSGEDGFGIEVVKGAALGLKSGRLHRNRGAGLLVRNKGSVVFAHDLLVDATEGAAFDQKAGFGVRAESGARIELQGARLSGNRVVGLHAVGSGSEIHGAGVLVDGTKPSTTSGDYGIGVQVATEARIELVGSLLTGNHMVGLFTTGAGATAALVGSSIRHTKSNLTCTSAGDGIITAAGAKLLDLKACTIFRNHTSGVTVNSGNAVIVDSVISTTLPGTFVHLKPGGGAGDTVTLADGLVISQAAQAAVVRSVLVGHQRAGMLLADKGLSTMTASVVSDNHFGLVSTGDNKASASKSAVFGNQSNLASDEGLLVPGAPGTAPACTK